ncbi:excinuclease ABC subunit UvrC [Vicingus serpentipes]|uniref:UvrABC system protein C n=1 Tax=Vicingus serpentipes TaxID=1926625 RepID=A0A5C6RP80_9FLAO|nr:excinuclease ABC subunit UvrC [Vicingus serpentipes]TXB64037.1 excinuclease ABC subunit UvrC [Vicingus serpentipes]
MSLNNIIKNLPNKPGVYQYYNTEGIILYVGKAKNLKKRVTSYFTKNHENGKTAILVRQIADIKIIVVETEIEALLLENNLIKKYQPKYNILLKDDKTYPWICIKNERFPRIFSTRNIIRDGSEYFGPYASVRMMNTILDLIRQLYPIRNCNYNLSEENIANEKFKVCLEYHIGNCKGPCIDEQSEDDYNTSINEIKNIIKGNINSVTKHLKPLMKEYADKLQFEKAQQIKEKIETLENYQSKSVVVSPTINDVDVFSIISDEKYGFVNYLKVINGAIIQGHTIELKKKLDETDDELLQIGIAELRVRFDSESKEVIVPFKPDLADENIKFTVPQRGDKKQLLDLSERNAKYFRLERNKQKANVNPTKHSDRILERMQKDLRMPVKPVHIECFDNSNIQGTNPVAACVVFKDAKPSKRDYRHFNIKTVEGPDDFASMEEVVYRRYKRLLDEDEPLPQLIIIDGGKGQLSSALKSLDKLNLRGKITIIGIAKKLEEIYFPGDSIPLYIDKKSESLKVIQYLRNEAHRFGITHHRNKRSKAAITSELDKIEGIGFKTAQQLLWKFKSVARIKKATLKELETAVNKQRAKIVFDHFSND